MQLIHLPLEILINITEFLSTKDILSLSICSKHFHNILSVVKFNENVKFKDISKLPYFDSFTNVEYYKSGKLFPRSLRILFWWNNDHLPSQLPDSLKSLYLGNDYNQPLLQLPNSLKSLYLGWYYDQPLPQLPNSLKSLYLGWNYDQPLPQLPHSLKSFCLGYSYDQALPQLPNSLKSLYLGSHYDQPLPQLPNSLKRLYLSFYFNQPLLQLPNSLKSLYLGYYYDQPLPQLPDSLRLLKVWRKFLLPALSFDITIEFFDGYVNT